VEPDRDLDDLTELAVRARDGDPTALDQLCRAMQQPVYRLALRFTGRPADAEDAAQEVMVRIVTHLGSFEARSRFTTWMYTLATRQLLRTAKRRAEASVVGAEAFGAFIDEHLGDPWSTEDEVSYRELCADVRLSCTYGMLLCLSREQRVAYLIGDLLGFADVDGAAICEITPAAFRQRLARARSTMRSLMSGRCGLVRSEHRCRCDRLVGASIDHGLLDVQAPAFARHAGVVVPIETDTLERAATQLDLAVAAAEIYRSSPRFEAPASLWGSLSAALPDLLES
jgi:DNA-directed RNA polymerase specialized sigma24 family protein